MPHRRSSLPPPPRSASPPAHAPPRTMPPSKRSSAGLTSFVGTAEVAALLAPWVADEEDREFIARCIATEGPPHHRVASFAMLRLLSQAVMASGGPLPIDEDGGLPVPLRLPPHLEREDDDASYPIRLPRRVIERLAPAGSREADTFVDALTDGPAHHALANVAMICLIDSLLERLSASNPRREGA
jgi:hypothetical protein